MTEVLASTSLVKATARPVATMELVCQADSLTSLRTVVDNGANCVHLDCQDNAGISEAVGYAHHMGCKVLLALNVQPQSRTTAQWRNTIDLAVRSRVDGIVFADPAMLLYASAHYPDLRMHFSMPDSTASIDAVNFFNRQFGIERIIMPRVLSLSHIEQMAKNTTVELEVSGFGKLCSIVEGRNGMRYEGSDQDRPETPAADPVIRMTGIGSDLQNGSVGLCANGETAANENYYAIQDSPDINALRLLPQPIRIDVRAVKVEAQGRGQDHAARVTRVWREAIDNCLENLQRYSVKPTWVAELDRSAGKLRPC